MSKAKQIDWRRAYPAPLVLLFGPESYISTQVMKSIRDQIRVQNPSLEITEISADESRIHLLLEFAFSNKLLTFTFSSVFEKIGHELIKAFVKRAGELYDQH